MKKMITILGPTASGKTSIAVALAADLDGEIISADSRQVYRLMDIGTGKDLSEYSIGTQKIPYHLIDIVDPGTKYNLFQFQEDFVRAYEDIQNRGKLPIFCGGSGLYLEAVLKGYNLSPVPKNKELREKLSVRTLDDLTKILLELKHRNKSQMHNTTDVDTVQRAIRAIEIETYNLENPLSNRKMPKLNSFIVGIQVGREERRAKITNRLKFRLENGMIEEVDGLLKRGIQAEDLIYYGLEYKYVTEYLIGKLNYQEMYNKLEIAIHQFSKRQMTWFRGMERRGFDIYWLDSQLSTEDKIKRIKQHYYGE